MHWGSTNGFVTDWWPVYGNQGHFPFSPKFWKFWSETQCNGSFWFGPTRVFGTSFEGGPLWSAQSFQLVQQKCPFPFGKIAVSSTFLLHSAYKNNNQMRGWWLGLDLCSQNVPFHWARGSGISKISQSKFCWMESVPGFGQEFVLISKVLHHYGRDPLNQNFRKFRSKTQWIGSVQPEKFRKNRSTFWGGALFPVGPVWMLVEWIAPYMSRPGEFFGTTWIRNIPLETCVRDHMKCQDSSFTGKLVLWRTWRCNFIWKRPVLLTEWWQYSTRLH